MPSEFEQIDIHKAKVMIDAGHVNVIDIRKQSFYDEEHIDQSIWVSDQNVEQFVKEANKDRPLICYCYQGFSSQDAARYFSQQGFKKVYSMIGGFDAWRTAYPFTGGK